MTDNQQLTSFGLFLQTARIEKKMSIEDLSAETRIRVEVLRRLETEELSLLPNDVFVKGFIRNYAHAVGADVEEALDRYRANCALHNVAADRKTAPPDRFWLVMVAAVGAVLLMAGLTIYGYSRLTAPTESEALTAPIEKKNGAPAVKSPVAEPAPIEKKNGAPAVKSPVAEPAPLPAASPQPAVAPPEEKTQAPSKRYMLEIRAIEETWLKIIVDDQKAQELTLKADEVRQIEAASLFNLLIGNAGGVELKLNGTPVEVTGKSGQVVNIQLP